MLAADAQIVPELAVTNTARQQPPTDNRLDWPFVA